MTDMLSHVSFTTIPVDDYDRAKAFYVDVLGMVERSDAAMGSERWIMLEVPGSRTRVHFDRREGETQALRPVLPMIAPDVAGAVETLRTRGAEIVREPEPAEWDAETTYAMIRDSEGNLVMIASR
jgi:predicted enzyme related to lactoylglutathione lyase